MNSLLAWYDAKAESLSDLFNPLLVRETRQALRGNAFVYAASLASCLSMLALVCGALSQSFDNSLDTGLYVFRFIFLSLWGACCLVMPLSQAFKARDESSGGEFELFAVTGISAGSIALGKLQASLLQTVLLCVLAAPFLLACLFLRGVSAPDILLALAGLLAYSVFLNQIGVLIGCLNLSKGMNSMLLLAFSGGLFMLLSLSFASLVERQAPFLFGQGENLALRLGSLFLLPACYGLLAFAASVALLKPESRDRAAGMKALLTLFSWGLLLLGGLTAFAQARSLLSWLVCLPLLLAALMLPWAKRALPAKEGAFAWLPRPLAWLAKEFFGPGFGSSLIWFSITMLGVAAFDYANMKDGTFCASFLVALFLFWALAGNLLGFVFRKAHPLALSLGGLIAPCAAAMVLAFSSGSKAAELLFPFVAQEHFEMAGQMKDAFAASCCFLTALLALGFALKAFGARRSKG